MSKDDWQLQAVHEQFEVFNSLRAPYVIDATDFNKILSTLTTIISRHFQRSQSSTISLRKLCAEIIKVTPEGHHINLSYIIIITDEDVNGKLSKFPVFIVKSNNTKVFIDINNTVHQSWEAFKSNNNLPVCQYCFPVSGEYYNKSGKLMIDFGSSPAASGRRHFWRWLGIALVGAGALAASYFFKISPSYYKRIKSVAKIAEQFVPSLGSVVSLITDLSSLIQKLRSGDISMSEFMVKTADLLFRVYKQFSEEINNVFGKVKKELHDFYLYLKKTIGNFFSSSQHEWMAIVSKHDYEQSKAEKEAEDQLFSTQKQGRNQEHFDSALNGLQNLELSTYSNKGYNKRIFENCQVDCSLQSGIRMENKSEPFLDLSVGETTGEILKLCKNVSEALKENRNPKDIFEVLSSIVLEEFIYKINQYTKMVEAAKAGAGHDINLDAFNKCLGIEGNPKDYYRKEALKTVDESRLLYRLIEKIDDKQKQKKMELILVFKKPGDSYSGLYKCSGIRGAGKFSSKALVSVLNDMFIELNIRNESVNETESQMIICCKKLTILVLQSISEENTSEAILYIENFHD